MSSITTWPSIDRQPAHVRTQVAASIRAAIVDGRLRPGDRLIERALSEQFGVSRPLLREAIRQLEAERLVEVVPNRGPVVRALNAAETADLVDICAHLEGLCAQYFVQRGSEQDLRKLREALLNFERVAEGGAPVAVRHAKAEYYVAFLSGCKSELLAEAINRHNAQLSQYWSSAIGSEARSIEGLKELRKILRSLEDRDTEAARLAAQTYVQHAGQYILNNVIGATGAAPRTAKGKTASVSRSRQK